MVLSNSQDYTRDASLIRQSFLDHKNTLEQDTTRTEDYKKTEIEKAKFEAQQKMSDLRATYHKEQEVIRNTREQDAFNPTGSPGEYFSVLNQADSANHADRLRMAKNALAMGTNDFVKAVARSALNAGDSSTLQYIISNSDESLASSINRAMEARSGRTGRDITFEMTTFTL